MEFWPPGGVWAQNLLKIGGFPKKKIPENCMVKKKILGPRGPGPQGPLDPLLPSQQWLLPSLQPSFQGTRHLIVILVIQTEQLIFSRETHGYRHIDTYPDLQTQAQIQGSTWVLRKISELWKKSRTDSHIRPHSHWKQRSVRYRFHFDAYCITHCLLQFCCRNGFTQWVYPTWGFAFCV